MEIEDTPDAAMIDDDLVARLDNPCEFPRSEWMGEGQTDDLLLDVRRHARFDGRLAAGMGKSPAIEEADKACALKASQIPPQVVIGKARALALLGERRLPLEDRAQHVVTCSRLLIHGGVVEKKVELRRGGGCCGHNVLPQSKL